ncbi:hypothetical protein KUTeg_018046 [Tegillarca granosa]|uniref:Uncharacterized protein n=1 Tax=Tegillarca granosa TaxID=220873 RepID=A0ABQ9EGP8_TEGGR|nr:hypothetical protein KUTeg_018046 [Tegillarca granosa]
MSGFAICIVEAKAFNICMILGHSHSVTIHCGTHLECVGRNISLVSTAASTTINQSDCCQHFDLFIVPRSWPYFPSINSRYINNKSPFCVNDQAQKHNRVYTFLFTKAQKDLIMLSKIPYKLRSLEDKTSQWEIKAKRGGFIFEHLEKKNEEEICFDAKEDYVSMETDTIQGVMNVIGNSSNKDQLALKLQGILTTFRDNSIKINYDGSNCSAYGLPDGPKYSWSWAGSLFFSVTVISTIGASRTKLINQWLRDRE